MISRKAFIMGASACGAALAFDGCVGGRRVAEWRPEKPWKGFNLLGMFLKDGNRDSPADERICGCFPEDDFLLLRVWGFNFARLPLDYRCFVTDGNWEHIDEGQLAKLDAAVEYGRRHGIHVQICLHRIPGFCVNPPKEPKEFQEGRSSLHGISERYPRGFAANRAVTRRFAAKKVRHSGERGKSG